MMKVRVRSFASLLVVGLLVASPPLAWGVDPAVALDEHVKVVNRTAKTPEGEQRVVEHLSRELNVPAATLRAQREQSKLGWGELAIAYRLSQETKIPVDQLIAEHKSGKGWGQIARENKLKLGPILSKVKKSSQALEAEADKGHEVKKADKVDKTDLAEKPQKERPDAAAERGGRGLGRMGGDDRPGGGPGKGRGR
jgi:predicted GIY-YIG superfamily endonuclease